MTRHELNTIITEVIQEQQNAAIKKCVEDIVNYMNREDPEGFKKIAPYLQSEEKFKDLMNSPGIASKVKAAEEKLGIGDMESIQSVSELAARKKNPAKRRASPKKGEKSKSSPMFTGAMWVLRNSFKIMQILALAFGWKPVIIGVVFLVLLVKLFGLAILGALFFIVKSVLSE